MDIKQDLPKITEESYPVGIVCTGGGAKGKYQAGVMYALAQAGILDRTVAIAGTSVGGLNTLLFSYFCQDPIKAIKVWEGIDSNKKVYKGSLDTKNFFNTVGLAWAVLTKAKSFLDPKPLYDILDNIFNDITLQDIRSLKAIDLIITSVDLNRQQEELYTTYDTTKFCKVKDIAKRTSAIPLVFPAIPGKDARDEDNYVHYHVDGGVGSNNPLEFLQDYFRDVYKTDKYRIIVIKCQKTEESHDGKEYKDIFEVATRTISSMLKVQEQLVDLDVDPERNYIIEPDTDTGDTLDFSNKKTLQAGYDYACSLLPELFKFIKKEV